MKNGGAKETFDHQDIFLFHLDLLERQEEIRSPRGFCWEFVVVSACAGRKTGGREEGVGKTTHARPLCSAPLPPLREPS